MRYEFGAGIADYVVTPSDGLWSVAAGAIVSWWDSPTDGTQYTDLQNLGGEAITEVKASEYGALPRFLGPPDVTGMWADAGGSSRAWVEAHQVSTDHASAPPVLDWLNVKEKFGAQGDGVADDTAALQAAVQAAADAGGGTLYIPAGRYRLTTALAWASGVNAVGAGARATILQTTNQNNDCITGTDISSVSLRDLQLSGPGRGFGSGVRFTRFSAPSTPEISLRNILIQSFGGDGVFCHSLASSVLHRVRVRTCGGVGFHLQAPQDTILGGASLSLTGCTVEGCVTGGYWLDGMAYTSLAGCGVQGSPVGYRLEACTGVSLTGCGAEQCTTGLTVYGGTGNTATGFVTRSSDGTSVWITSAAKGIVLSGVTELAPGAGATTCLRTDAGTVTTTLGLTAVKPNALSGTVINPSA
ncbi:glycosyl hydrolase family 28-related protein [Streptomyces nodosus]|uniref:glycosyl hydrolase family 28-related protein n=1 Tax=Streptomyces nodosus TaxID=40318 RepID=UPI00380440C2